MTAQSPPRTWPDPDPAAMAHDERVPTPPVIEPSRAMAEMAPPAAEAVAPTWLDTPAHFILPPANVATPVPSAPPPLLSALSPGGTPCVAERIVAAPLAELNHLELIARLANALDRRGAARHGAHPGPASPIRPTAPAPEPDIATRLNDALASLRALG